VPDTPAVILVAPQMGREYWGGPRARCGLWLDGCVNCGRAMAGRMNARFAMAVVRAVAGNAQLFDTTPDAAF